MYKLINFIPEKTPKSGGVILYTKLDLLTVKSYESCNANED